MVATKPKQATRDDSASLLPTVLLACALAGILGSVPELVRIVSNNAALISILAGAWFAMGSMTLMAIILAVLSHAILRPLAPSPLRWGWDLLARLQRHVASPVPSRVLARNLLAQATVVVAGFLAMSIVGLVLAGLFASKLPPWLSVVCGLIGVTAGLGVAAYSVLLYRRWSRRPWFQAPGGGRLISARWAHLHELALIGLLCVSIPVLANRVLDRLGLMYLFDLVILTAILVVVCLLMARFQRQPRRPLVGILLLILLTGVPFGLGSLEARSALGGRNSFAGLLRVVAYSLFDFGDGFSLGTETHPGSEPAGVPPVDGQESHVVAAPAEAANESRCAGMVNGQFAPTCGDPAFQAALARARAAYKVPSDAQKPDILLVTWDATRADHLSLYGYQRPTSTNMDALAAKGTVFTGAQSASARTNQAVPALLTGRHAFNVPGRFMALWFYMFDEALVFPELLQKAGYVTAAVGIGGDFDGDHNWNQGFDHWIQPKTFTPSDETGPTQVEASVDILRKLHQDPAKPLFFWVHLADPHDWYLRHEGTPWEMKNDVDAYDSELWFTDKNTRVIIDEFDRTSRPRIIVFLADHGEALGDHGDRAHRELYLGITHVPLMVLVDGLQPSRVTVPVSALDVFPTLLDLLGLEHPAGLDGCSLLPALMGDSMEGRGPVFSAFANSTPPKSAWVSVLDGRYRMMRELLFGTNLMYDLQADPGESTNIFGTESPEKDCLFQTLNGFADRGGSWLVKKPK
jgi:arylsulfatase A-like enzyme